MSFAHGEALTEPSLSAVLGAWPIEPLVWLGVIAAAWLYVDAARRASSWAGSRRVHFLMGLAAVSIALITPLAVYAESLFWVHMIQHLLLVLIAAPLLALGAPVALALKSSRPPVRRRLQEFLGSRVARFFSHPAVAWSLFAVILWTSHASGIYNAALEEPLLHGLEHAVYLGAAFLFWQPVVGLDPRPGKLTPPARVGYLVAAIPMQSFLGVALYSADEVLYPHYGSVVRDWGPTPIDDQGAAALVMWLGGDALMLVALGFTVAAWMRYEGRRS